MAIYQHIETPFGNFAISTYYRGDWKPGEVEILAKPIGDLDHVPTKVTREGLRHIDLDALEDEARRQSETLGRSFPAWLVPRPVFTVNGVHYDEEVRVRFHNLPQTYGERAGERVATTTAAWSIGQGSLTDSARRKLSEFFLENEDTILNHQFLAEDAHDEARRGLEHARGRESEARAALRQASEEVEKMEELVAITRARMEA